MNASATPAKAPWGALPSHVRAELEATLGRLDRVRANLVTHAPDSTTFPNADAFLVADQRFQDRVSDLDGIRRDLADLLLEDDAALRGEPLRPELP